MAPKSQPKASAKLADAASKSKRYWLAYDVALNASFDGLFAWLDNHQAQECGDNLATLSHESDFDELAGELQRLIGSGIRVYLIGKVKNGSHVFTRGKFIRGRRKAAPWSGYGNFNTSDVDE